jgi:propanol-preferring alcohol dehydrogenase
MAAVRSPGAVLLVGGAGGAVPFGHTTLPRGVTIQSPTGSTAGDLQDVLRLARAGQLRIEAEQFRLSDADRAYAALREGRLRSRAVVIP